MGCWTQTPKWQILTKDTFTYKAEACSKIYVVVFHIQNILTKEFNFLKKKNLKKSCQQKAGNYSYLGKKKSFILRLWPAYIVGIKMFFLGETTMIVNIFFIRHQKKKKKLAALWESLNFSLCPWNLKPGPTIMSAQVRLWQQQQHAAWWLARRVPMLETLEGAQWFRPLRRPAGRWLVSCRISQT